MTFLAYEQSAQLASPVELYRYSMGNQFFYQTSYDVDYIFGAITYTKLTISRGPINQSNEGAKNDLKVTSTVLNPIAELFKGGPPRNHIKAEIYRVHANDPDQEARLIWDGFVLHSKTNGFEVEFTFRPFLGLLKQQILRPTFQRKCNHTIYDQFCGLNQTVHELTTGVDSKTGLTVTVGALPGAFADGELVGGIITNLDGGMVMITSNTGTNLTILHELALLDAPNVIKIAPGCQQLPERCKQLLNYDNYFGFKDVPNIDLHSVNGVKGDT